MAGSGILAEGLPGFRVSTLRAASSTPQNSLEAGFQVDTLQDGAVAYVLDQLQSYRWFQDSLATPSDPTIIIPLGQSLSEPGRWIATGTPEEVHYVFSTADLPEPVDRERILTDGIWIFMARIDDRAPSLDPTEANSLVIPAGGKVELISGQMSFENSVSAWGYHTNSDRPALRIEQSARHAFPFFIWNLSATPTPSLQTDAGVDVDISNWQMGMFSTGPVVFNGSANLNACHISSTVEFAGGSFFYMSDCQHGGMSITGIAAGDNSDIAISSCRQHEGTGADFLTIPAGVGINLGGVRLTSCRMSKASTGRLVNAGADYNKNGSPYLKIVDCAGGSPSLGVVPAGGLDIRGFQRNFADGGFVGFTAATAKVFVRESFDETGAKLTETALVP